MTESTMPQLDMDGPAAPPRRNGELVFNAPWESRSFAMAFALVERGEFSWDEFRDHLIACIARWEKRLGDDGGAETRSYRYYERWQEALESILSERSMVQTADIDIRARAFASRPAGHDHRHDHVLSGHDDDHDHQMFGHDHGHGHGLSGLDHGHGHGSSGLGHDHDHQSLELDHDDDHGYQAQTA